MRLQLNPNIRRLIRVSSLIGIVYVLGCDSETEPDKIASGEVSAGMMQPGGRVGGNPTAGRGGGFAAGIRADHGGTTANEDTVVGGRQSGGGTSPAGGTSFASAGMNTGGVSVAGMDGSSGGQIGLSGYLCLRDEASGVCDDQCPDGRVCDEACRNCIRYVPRECSQDAAGVCQDICPDGLVCNEVCGACVAVGPIRCTPQPEGTCVDECPDGTQCDPNCQGCIRINAGCHGPDSCDGIDNDCDGRVDEDAQPIASSCGIGYCATQGQAECVDGVFVGTCIPGEPLEGPDECRGGDSDCDGQIDEDCGPRTCRLDAETMVCTDDCPAGQVCSTDCRQCVPAGPQRCARGEGEVCEDRCPLGTTCDPNCQACVQVNEDCAQIERCDGFDNDCDGRVDEALLNLCGQCGPEPVEVCDGEDNDCDHLVDEELINPCGACGPAPIEVCDGADNDCDGRIDESLINRCGECGAAPVEVCDGVDNDCDHGVDEGLLNACGHCGEAPLEVCDDIDNDCDGRTDEALLNNCGRCGTVPDETCDGVDNDCDQLIDEGSLCEEGAECRGGSGCVGGNCENGGQRPCGVDIGACQAGVQRCTNNAWGGCEGAIGPADETCDGADNDCDGIVDNGDLCSPGQFCSGGQCIEQVCTDGQTEVCGSNVGACQAGVQRCTNNAWGDCEGAIGSVDETCDGADNDCDGIVDNGDLCLPGQFCSGGQCIERVCTDGQTRVCGTDVGACR
ncbi:MAG: MopE-related protein, partial [Myxococcota bacterium]|nr:MopE-related protein [Myxococcota bacterium]